MFFRNSNIWLSWLLVLIKKKYSIHIGGFIKHVFSFCLTLLLIFKLVFILLLHLVKFTLESLPSILTVWTMNFVIRWYQRHLARIHVVKETVQVCVTTIKGQLNYAHKLVIRPISSLPQKEVVFRLLDFQDHMKGMLYHTEKGQRSF